MTTTLRTVRPGETVRVSGIKGSGAIKRRVMDMGITKGVDIFVRKVAPLGDPVEVTVRCYELSLRKADAEIVEVVLVGTVSAGVMPEAAPAEAPADTPAG
jgi:ferrous iron transport protein A